MPIRQLRYHISLRPEPEGGFTVTVPALPGCVTYGRDITEAQQMARDAIRGYLVSCAKHGESIPQETEGFLTTTIEIPVTARYGAAVS